MSRRKEKRFLSFCDANSEWISAFLTTRREKIESSEYNWNVHVVPAHLVSYLQLEQSFYSRGNVFQTQRRAEKCLVSKITEARSTERNIKEDSLYCRLDRKLSSDPGIRST